VRQPQHKGKVERNVQQIRRRLQLAGRRFHSLEELQSHTDERLESDARRRTCPPTGSSVQEAWLAERKLLARPERLPAVFDVSVMRPVHQDCLVNFEGRSYSAPLRFCRRQVEVRGCSGVVQLLFEGRLIAEHPRHTRERLVIDPSHYEDAGDDRVCPPPPLGRLTRRILEIAEAEVEVRAADYYAQLMEAVQ